MRAKHPFQISLDEIQHSLNNLLISIRPNQFFPKESIVFNNEEIQKIFKVSPKTVKNWCDSGILKPIKIGGIIRFKLIDIIELIENSEVSPKKKQ